MLLTLLGLSALAVALTLGCRLWAGCSALLRQLPQHNDDFLFF